MRLIPLRLPLVTSCLHIIIIVNASESSQRNRRDNVEVPPVAQAVQQPFDMGIISALKKRYKYLYLKEVLNYYEMDDALKSIKAVQGKQLSRGAAGVAYGNAAHLLDAANFVKEAWDAISAETIANSFAKTEIMTLKPVPVENSENEWINEIISMFAKVSIEIDVNDAINFERIDEENTEEYVQEILKDVDDVLEDVKEVPDESHLSDDSDLENNECLVKFEGFDNLCEMAINIENQLLCPVVKNAAGADYNDLLCSFENFQNKLKK